MIAIDLDGTLLDSQKRLHPETVRVIAEVKRRGIMVTIATGRTLGSARPYAEKLGIELPLITYNGAHIAAITGRQTIEKTVMPMELAGAMIGELEHAGCYVKLYGDDHLYVQERTRETVDFSRRFGVPFTAVGKYKLAGLPVNPLKVTVIERTGLIDQAWRILQTWKDKFTISRDGEYGIEIMAKMVNKGAALEKLCGLLAVSLEDVMAIGNEGNDVEMIARAGVGVAMGNAYDELKSLAALVTGTNDDLGVAHVLRKYILQERP